MPQLWRESSLMLSCTLQPLTTPSLWWELTAYSITRL
jgi:hypothetical protein